jgi:hypothetical protein
MRPNGYPFTDLIASVVDANFSQLLTFLFWRWLDGFVGRLTEGRDRLTQQP